MFSRLFERLAEHKNLKQVSNDNKSSIHASLREHLLRLLNTKRGSVLVDLDYGVPYVGLASLTSDEFAIQRYLKHIENTIKHYEPRIEQVRVSPVNGQNQQSMVKFKIELSVRPEGKITQPSSVSFLGSVRTDGTVTLDDEYALH